MPSFFGKIQSIAGKAGNMAAQLSEKTVNEYLPLIAKLLRKKAGPAVLDILNDPSRVTELSRTVYQVMPMPLRMAVREDAFNSMVLAHKDKLSSIIRSQIEVEDPDHPDESGVPCIEGEAGVQECTGTDVVDSPPAGVDEVNCSLRQADNLEDPEVASNTTSPST